MKVSDFIYMGIGSVLVIFMLLTFFYNEGSHYGMDESKNYGNISLADYNKSLKSAQQTSESLRKSFETENPIIASFNLVFKALPSAGKTIFRWSVDSIHLVLVGATKVLATEAFGIAFGVLMAVLIVIFIITNWDWIRGLIPGT
jgi:hypothetical protein